MPRLNQENVHTFPMTQEMTVGVIIDEQLKHITNVPHLTLKKQEKNAPTRPTFVSVSN